MAQRSCPPLAQLLMASSRPSRLADTSDLAATGHRLEDEFHRQRPAIGAHGGNDAAVDEQQAAAVFDAGGRGDTGALADQVAVDGGRKGDRYLLAGEFDA